MLITYNVQSYLSQLKAYKITNQFPGVTVNPALANNVILLNV